MVHTTTLEATTTGLMFKEEKMNGGMIAMEGMKEEEDTLQVTMHEEDHRPKNKSRYSKYESNIKVEYIGTKDKIVDIFTKPLPCEMLKYLLKKT